MRTLIIAEAGVNHNGDLDMAFRLCDAAKESGADIIKFQMWKTENIITHNVEQADYQKKNAGKEESQFDMLKRLELSFQSFKRIKEYCDSVGILFASTADDKESLDFLVTLGVPFIKVGSGEIGNIPFLKYIGSKHLPVILSTGMSTLADIDISLHALQEGGTDNITILHCTTSYPCPYEDVNLNAMKTLKNAFHLSVGYSDHTLGTEVPVAAVAMGAAVIEKHFTLDKGLKGPDHAASMEPGEFKKMVQAIRNIECAMGTAKKAPTDAERKISSVVIKRIVAKSVIEKGQPFTEDNLTVKRNDSGIPAKYWDLIIGSKANNNYLPDQAISLGAVK